MLTILQTTQCIKAKSNKSESIDLWQQTFGHANVEYHKPSSECIMHWWVSFIIVIPGSMAGGVVHFLFKSWLLHIFSRVWDIYSPRVHRYVMDAILSWWKPAKPVQASINNHICQKLWDVLFHPCPNQNRFIYVKGVAGFSYFGLNIDISYLWKCNVRWCQRFSVALWWRRLPTSTTIITFLNQTMQHNEKINNYSDTYIWWCKCHSKANKEAY